MRLQVLLMNFDVSLKSSQQDRERKKEMAISHLSTQGSLALTKIRCLKVGEENREEEMDEDTVRWTESEAGMAKRSWEMEKKSDQSESRTLDIAPNTHQHNHRKSLSSRHGVCS